jgi:hypothetical protein
MNRVHVHAFNVKQNLLMNRNDESSSILFSMKKNRQFSSDSKIANKMNIENDFIDNENFEIIASYTYVNLIIKTKIFSTKKFVFIIQTKAFHAKFDSRLFKIKKTAREIQENVSSRCRKNRQYCLEKND